MWLITHSLQSQKNPTLSPTSYVALGQSLNLSEVCFPHLVKISKISTSSSYLENPMSYICKMLGIDFGTQLANFPKSFN